MLKRLLYIPLGLVLLVYPFSTLFLAKVYFITVAISFVLMLCIECLQKKNTLISVIIRSKWFLIIQGWFLLSTLLYHGFDFYNLSSVFLPILFVVLVHYAFVSFGQDKLLFFRRLLFILFFAFLIADFYLLLLYGNLRASNQVEKEVIGSFANVNIAIMTMTVVYNFVFYKHTRSIWYLIIIAVASFMIVATMSRAGLLLLAGALVYGIYLLSLRGKRVFYGNAVAYFVVTILPIIIIIFSVPGLQHKALMTIERFDVISEVKLADFVRGEMKESDDRKRQIQFIAALEVIMDKPFTGIGFGNFPEYVESNYGVRVSVHNMFLKAWVSVGVGSFILMVFFFAQLFRSLVKRRKLLLQIGEFRLAEVYSATIVMLVLFLVQGQFRGMFGDLSFLFFIGFAHALAGWALVGRFVSNRFSYR